MEQKTEIRRYLLLFKGIGTEKEAEPKYVKEPAENLIYLFKFYFDPENKKLGNGHYYNSHNILTQC